MDQATHNKIVSFIWEIADDVPMCVIRRMDAVLEPTKPAVLDAKKMLDKIHITAQCAALSTLCDTLLPKLLSRELSAVETDAL